LLKGTRLGAALLRAGLSTSPRWRSARLTRWRPCNTKSPGQRGVLTEPVYDGRVEEIVAALMHRH